MYYIYPPRPKGNISPCRLAYYESGWIAQRKFNGARNGIYISPEGFVQFSRGHAGPNNRYLPPAGVVEQISELRLKPGIAYWLDSELLGQQTKNPAYKDKVVLYDVLHADKYLFGASLEYRLSLLNEICGKPTKKEPSLGIALQVTRDIYMAETFADHFVDRYNDFLLKDEIEGLVLKRKESALDNLGQSSYEVAWQLRCRKPQF